MNPSVALVMVDVKSVGPDDGLTLSRWSRLKRRGGGTAVAPSTEAPAAPEVANEATLPTAGAADAANVAELNLPQLSSISLVEDFTPFMQAKVPQAIRQQALKALFKEPHFNVMDGLDTYIDDYTVFEPITPEVMATLSSWKTIMNPTQQVVTPGGYAVDVESEEGRAVLAARAEAASLDQTVLLSNDTPHPGAHMRQACLALPQGERGSESLNPNVVPNEQGSAPSRLVGEGWGEGVAAERSQRPRSHRRPPPPQPLPHRGGGEPSRRRAKPRAMQPPPSPPTPPAPPHSQHPPHIRPASPPAASDS